MRIIRVPIAPLYMINAFVISTDSGAVIVDTGLPGMAGKFHAALASDGKDWSDVKLIIVTHAHVDHAGAAARLRQLTGAPILAHQADRLYYNHTKQIHYCPTGPFGRLFKATGLAAAPYDAFEADIELAGFEQFSLREFGIEGHVEFTPGHTEGSLSVLLDNGNALVSDLVASGILLGGIIRLKHPKRPPFEDDPRLVADQLQRLIDNGSTHFHIGHGATLGSTQISQHIQRLRRL
ncbi:MBL fold metallo-hydrolase [Rhizobium sp. L1K21]|uniref:MBL fold metallo-hydrolase n=1 Tax=Rhizobium sp. L1K21 TaxID=2954933 RepID=UPI002091F617|nr:MBL fold metallo-hydrolase [Rhizobium sp. L1K21]MCO6186356.1 MBL fold metallo-hydrolase [Rhizobium sp. L1K21]